jgi:hypothetical protein
MIRLNQLKPNSSNPRIIKDEKFKKLVQSVKEFPKMMALRPIVIDDDGTILGGNMRYRALLSLGYKEVPDEWVRKASELTDEEKQRFIIEDNVPFGEWDWEKLANEWDDKLLEEWGVDIPKKTATELLSELKIESIYYEPELKPSLRLKDCVNTEKYDKKMEIVNSANVSSEIKEVFQLLATRFVKIDYEAIANYYAYNATEEEKKVIERLRLVLIDNGIDGFIEDELLKIKNKILSND